MVSREISISRFHSYLERNDMMKHPHQEEGIWWCVERELQLQRPKLESTLTISKGGIVADEMGLGKTVLMLGLTVVNFVRRTLIVVPLPLVSQWKREIKRTLGHDVLVYHGPEKKHLTVEMVRDAPIVLTTYGGLKPNGKYNLYGIKWDRIIYDEAHHMRNSSSNKYFYGTLLRSKYKWLLSGTPVQNKIGDLFSLFHILGYKHKDTINYEIFRKLCEFHIIRRKKIDVGINLPPVNIVNINVDWKNKYEKEVSTKLHNLVENKISPNDLPWLENIGDLKIIQMIRAKQMCVCPRLLEQKIRPMITKGILEKDYETMFTSTSKLDSVIRLIKDKHKNNNKKIVFCTFHEEMKTLKEKLKKEDITSVGIYSGRLNIRARQKIISDDYSILLMQIQTGCEGLNLQQYNEIYFTSPHWNPCIEDQAIGRCYRMGQKKETFVYNFNMETLSKDDKIYSMDKYVRHVQNDKRALQEKIL